MNAIDSRNAQPNSREGALELAAAAADRGGVGRGHAQLGGRLAQRLQAIGERVARRDAGAHVGLALAIEAIDARRALRLLE